MYKLCINYAKTMYKLCTQDTLCSVQCEPSYAFCTMAEDKLWSISRLICVEAAEHILFKSSTK